MFGRFAEGDPLDCDGKSDSSPEREPCDDHLKAADDNDSNKKRKRKPYRPGERVRESEREREKGALIGKDSFTGL